MIMIKRNLILSLAMVFCSIGFQALYAQDGGDLLQDAKKKYSSFEINPTENFSELVEATSLISKSLEYEDFKNDAKVLNIAGEIYNKLATEEIKKALLGNGTHTLQYPDAGLKAYSYYTKALKNAEKGRREREAQSGLRMVASNLSNIGNYYLGTQEYAKAFAPLDAVIEIDKILKNKEEEGVFEKEEDLNNHKFVTGIAAQAAQQTDRSKELLEELYALGYNDARVYSTYYGLLKDTDPSKASQVLEKGKELFPDSQDLLYAEINSLIAEKKYDKLETLLQKAITKDPENASVRNALGNVYLNLYNKHMEAGDTSAQGYFGKAADYFNQALSIDPTSFDATYSLGSLYFNRGAALTQEMAGLGMSNEDLKKYEALDKEVKALFDKALPYFKKAEKMNPNDLNTVIALKEMYARLDNMKMVTEFTDRMKKIQGGQKITESFFKE